MFDIGFPELVLIAIVGLLVIGPERLPEALRTLGLWLGRLRRSFASAKAEIEKEIGMDEVRRQLHNEAVMEEMKRIEQEVRTGRVTGPGTGSGNDTGHGDAAEVALEDEPPYVAPDARTDDAGAEVREEQRSPSTAGQDEERSGPAAMGTASSGSDSHRPREQQSS